MNIKPFLGKDIYYNCELADALKRKEDPSIGLLKYDLTWTEVQNEKSAVEKRLGADFDNLVVKNYITRLGVRNPPTKRLEIERTENALNHFKLQDNCSLEDYLDAGESVIKQFNFPYHRFTTEQARAFMVMAELQQKTFEHSTPYDLFLGNAAERAMHEFLIEENKEFIGRSVLIYNSNKPQEEKDIRVFNDHEFSLGVRCQKKFTAEYLYNKKRLQKKREKIADYVAFFNHFGHHIFYLTGIVEKDFLRKKYYSTLNTMEEFCFPEVGKESRIIWCYINDGADKISELSKEQKQELREKLAKRLSFDDFLKRLKNK